MEDFASRGSTLGDMAVKPGAHHPPHFFVDEEWHMITAATVDHARFLSRDGANELLRDAVKDLIQQLDIELLAWVILDNHYHLILRHQSGTELGRFCRLLHGRTARQINILDGVQRRQVWHNFWDSCVFSERALWTRFNYVHQNPVKHGYVPLPEDWPHSSHAFYRRTLGEEWLADCWTRYPVVDYSPEDRF